MKKGSTSHWEKLVGRLLLALGAGALAASAVVVFFVSPGGPRGSQGHGPLPQGKEESPAALVRPKEESVGARRSNGDDRPPPPGQDQVKWERIRDSFGKRHDAMQYSFEFPAPEALYIAYPEVFSGSSSHEESTARLYGLLQRPDMAGFRAEIHLFLAKMVAHQDKEEFDRLIRLAEVSQDSPTSLFERTWFSEQLYSSGISWIHAASREPMEAYFDSIGEYKQKHPELWAGVALYQGAKKMTTDESARNGYLEELISKQPHAKYFESDTKFLSQRLRERPFFATTRREFYYLRTEDFAAVDLAEHRFQKGDYQGAENLYESLLAKHAALPIPNVSAQLRLAECRLKTGEPEAARQVLFQAREAFKLVEGSKALKPYAMEEWEKGEVNYLNPESILWPHSGLFQARREIERLQAELDRRP